ncbi:MAG TPA: hypothetical protein VJH92_06210 [Candidatus Nanoarchaeia archaeon]|nr:hypothetical protein [Candidatus Nanoarchaeia archaeon]
MTTWDNRGAAYNEKRDGSLEEYFEDHDGISAFPLFYGYGQFKMLWDRGYLMPSVSIIRVMWNVGRGDEHFGVVDENTLEGISAPMHSGRPGIHDVRKVLDDKKCPAWEAQYLDPKPTPRR